MKPSPAKTDELKQTIGVKELDEVDEQRFAQFLKRVAQGQLSEDQLNRLAFVLPQFLPLLAKTVEELGAGVKSVAEGAQSGQKAALEAIGRSLDTAHQTLLVLAHNAQTDETRLLLAKIALEAARQGLELAGIVERMNAANNAFWDKALNILGVAGASVGMVAAVALAVFISSRGKGDDKS